MRPIFLFFSFFLCSFSFSQQPAFFILGEKEFEGVQIYDVIQDDDLNYWFATDQGFYKYDNYRFVRVECEDMKGLAAFGFVKSKKGVIFCYNLNHQIMKIEKGKCSLFYELKGKEISNDVYLITTEKDELMVITHEALVFDAKGNRKNLKSISPGYYGFPFELPGGSIISHMADQDSLLVYDGNRLAMIPMKKDKEPIKGVLKFFVLGSTTYAISTAEKRVYEFKENSRELIRVEKFAELDEKEFLRFYNEQGVLWLAGAVSGVRKLSGNEQLDLSEWFYKDYLISDIFEDFEGNLLMSTFNHGVLVIPDGRIKDVLDIPQTSSIVSTHKDEDMGLLYGTLEGKLISYRDGTSKVISEAGSRPLQSIFSWQDFPYVLFDDGQIKLLNKKTGEVRVSTTFSLKDAVLFDDQTMYLALNIGVGKLSLGEEMNFEVVPGLRIRSYAIGIEKSNSMIYAATSEGLKMLDANGKINEWKLDGAPVFVNDIFNYEDSVFLATKKNGILVFKNGLLKRQFFLKLNDELVELNKLVVHPKVIYGLTADGFIVFDQSTNTATQLNKVHGFSTNKIFDFEISGDTLLINHSKGIQKVLMSDLYPEVEKPLIFLKTVTVNDRDVTQKSDGIEFGYNERNFRFIFSSPSLRNKENIRYHYKLEGYNDEWQTADYFENEITYNALAPGEYTFRVKAENQGLFSETVSYSFIISAPVYLRWWFITGAALLVLTIISLIYRNKLIAQRKKAKQQNELNASKLTAIQSQMNPHFIFNSLNSIQDLVLKGDVDNSYTFITKFSDLVRRTLSYSEKDFIEFDQELKLIELYLTLEKLRFKEELEYSIDKNDVEDIMIPPMLVQPFIENALVHGLLHKEGIKKLKIRFQLKELLICEITDNGVGRKKSAEIKNRQRADHESFASNAIKKRFEILSEHFQNKLGFEYEDLYEGEVPIGTKVTLFIPIKHKF